MRRLGLLHLLHVGARGSQHCACGEVINIVVRNEDQIFEFKPAL